MSASSFTVTKAEREGTPALISLWGPSGSGKTYSALLIARGLVGPEGKIVLIDTENKRAKFYATLAGGWHHIDLQPPFTPTRYTQAMAAAEAAGADAIIVDSGSHVWQGEGGVLEMAEENNRQGRLGKWKSAKMAYQRMMNNLLRAPVHVIFCLRAKRLLQQVKNAKGETDVVDMGMIPVAERFFKSEMTVDVQLDQYHLPVEIKCPEELAPALPLGSMLSIETGQMIADWVGGGAPVDHAAEAAKKEARDIATMGTERFRQYWSDLSKDKRNVIRANLPEFQSIAAEADEQAAQADPGDYSVSDDPLDDAPPQSASASSGAITDTEPHNSE